MDRTGAIFIKKFYSKTNLRKSHGTKPRPSNVHSAAKHDLTHNIMSFDSWCQDKKNDAFCGLFLPVLTELSTIDANKMRDVQNIRDLAK